MEEDANSDCGEDKDSDSELLSDDFIDSYAGTSGTHYSFHGKNSHGKNSLPWCGLPNPKNTICFANSILQAWAIAFFPMAAFQEKLDDKFIKKSSELKYTKTVASSFLGLMNSLDLSNSPEKDWELLQSETNKKVQKLLNACAKMDNYTGRDPLFNGNHQDANMYLDRLLQYLDPFLPAHSFQTHGFITCSVCKNSYETRKDPRKGWSLVIPQELQEHECVSMQELLNKYFYSEDIFTSDCAMCGKVEHKVYGFGETYFAPKHDKDKKRFMFIHVNRNSGVGTKLCTKVTLPSQTVTVHDLNTWKDLTFQVEAIVSHVGSSVSSGHYIAYSRKGIFNDSAVNDDGGYAFSELLSKGVYNNAYGDIYFFVQEDGDDLQENDSSSSSSGSSTSEGAARKEELRWCGLPNPTPNSRGSCCFANAIIQSFAVAFFPIPVFKNVFRKRLSAIQTDDIEKLAQSFFGIMNCLDLSTMDELKRSYMQSKTNSKVKDFHDLFATIDEERGQEAVFLGNNQDAKLYMDRLWKYLEYFFPQHLITEYYCNSCKIINTTNPRCKKKGWSLDLPTETTERSLEPVSMQDLLHSYMKSDETDVTCTNSTCNSTATLKLCSRFCPQKGGAKHFMFIHLNRFVANNEKLCTKVTLPSQTVTVHDLNTRKDLTFRVESIVAHVGSSVASGHYIAYSRKGIFDDSAVNDDGGKAFRELLSQGVHNDAYGYIYFFVRKEELWWCGLPNPTPNSRESCCFANAIIQSFAIAFFPIPVFKQNLKEDKIRRSFQGNAITSAIENLALSFLGIMNCLDLSTMDELKWSFLQSETNTKVKDFHDLFATIDEERGQEALFLGNNQDAKLYMDRLWEYLKCFIPRDCFTEYHYSICNSCKTVNTTNQRCKKGGWSLALPRESLELVSMRDLLRDYMKSDDEAEADVTCTNFTCNSTYKAKLELGSWFDAQQGDGKHFMFIHVNRFVANNEKLCTKVTLPSQTVTVHDLNTRKDLTFRVESIVAHVGSSVASGHYIAYSRKGIFDDSAVNDDGGKAFRELLSQGVYNNAYGYIYFFVEGDGDGDGRDDENGNDDNGNGGEDKDKGVGGHDFVEGDGDGRDDQNGNGDNGDGGEYKDKEAGGHDCGDCDGCDDENGNGDNGDEGEDKEAGGRTKERAQEQKEVIYADSDHLYDSMRPKTTMTKFNDQGFDDEEVLTLYLDDDDQSHRVIIYNAYADRLVKTGTAGYFNDALIDFCIVSFLKEKTMGERAGMLYYAGALFYTKLKESFSRNEYENVKRWIKVDILGGSYSSFLFPIHQPSPEHWYLVVFIRPHIVFGQDMNDAEEPCVLVLDSITKNNCHHDEVVTSLKSYFVEKWLDDKVKGTEEHERLRKLYIDKFDEVETLILQCPSQDNMHDCGGFTCKNAANIIVSRPSYKSGILVDYEGKPMNYNNYAQKDVTAYRKSVMSELQKRIASKL